MMGHTKVYGNNYEFKEKILSMAVKFPQAFMIRPKGNSPNGTFAKYNFWSLNGLYDDKH